MNESVTVWVSIIIGCYDWVMSVVCPHDMYYKFSLVLRPSRTQRGGVGVDGEGHNKSKLRGLCSRKPGYQVQK